MSEAWERGSSGARSWFAVASRGYLEAVTAVSGDQLGRLALGEWTLRDLLGHTSRAYLTIEAYVASASAPDDRSDDDAVVFSAAEYYRRVASSGGTGASVAQRGRDAGIALGDEPVAATRQIAERVAPVVDATPDALVVTTPFGTMRFGDYLETRAFELTVHGLDVVRALGVAPPAPLAAAFAPALRLIGEIATGEQLAMLLSAATGRGSIATGFAVIS